MFKHNVGDLVYYLNNNTVHSAPILSRMYYESESINIGMGLFIGERSVFTSKGVDDNYYVKGTQVLYQTCHGVFTGDIVYSSKEELADYIINGGD